MVRRPRSAAMTATSRCAAATSWKRCAKGPFPLTIERRSVRRSHLSKRQELPSMLTTRRELLAGAGAIGFAAAFPALARSAPGDAQATALLDAIADELLADFPETAAGLGIDKGPRAA